MPTVAWQPVCVCVFVSVQMRSSTWSLEAKNKQSLVRGSQLALQVHRAHSPLPHLHLRAAAVVFDVH